MRSPLPLALFLCAALAGCSSGNVRAPGAYNAPAPPPIKSFWYDPNAAYGSSNAIWRPPVYDRQGTIVKPAEPSPQGFRPDYENAPWATGAGGGSQSRPPGTF